MSELLYDIAVVGGGASGMIAALSAVTAAPHLKIAVLERLNRVGKKLMATGNGRCNITNMNASEKDYHGSISFMVPAMTQYPPEKVLDFFQTLGVYPREEEDGRVYPMSDQASSVLDALRLSMEERGIEEICDFEVIALTRAKDGYRLTARDNRQIIARRVVCAAGGLASPSLGGSASGYKLLESCGHELTPRFPALVQLKCNPDYTRPLKGSKYSGVIELLVDGRPLRRETGEILFTEYGLSGIAVMQLSRIASQEFAGRRPRNVEVRLRLLPMTFGEALPFLRNRRLMLAQRSLENFLTGLVNKRVGQMLIKWNTGLTLTEKSELLTDEHLTALASALTGWTIEITGTQGFDQAQVTAGGIKTQDVNPHTMESLLADGLYITGEILDIDGDCGGFNLQWAWASGLTAGKCCAQSLTGISDDPLPSDALRDWPGRNAPIFRDNSAPMPSDALKDWPDRRPPRRKNTADSLPYDSPKDRPGRKPSRPAEPHRKDQPPRRPDSKMPHDAPKTTPSPKRTHSTQPSKGMKKPHD